MGEEEIDVLGQMVMARRVKQRLFGATAPMQGSRYVPIERVGQGGAGIVYRAYDSKLRREVAIKLLHVAQDEGIDKIQATKVMMREARSLASLSHPHVVAVHDVGQVVGGELVSGFSQDNETDGPVFLVMEYIEGQDLGSYIRQKSPSYEEILSLFDQAARGLQAAHEIGLIHRDFKPANVLVGKDGRVRVIDFGLARQEPAALAEIPTLPTQMHADPEESVSTGIVGTPAYMSPEARTRQPAGPKSDQFSFCVAFYEAVYGLRPLPCTAQETPAQIPAHLHKLPEGTPQDLDKRLAKGLQVNADDRYPTLADLMSQLKRARPLRVSRWWPLIVAPAIAACAWYFWQGDVSGICANAPQTLRITQERTELEEILNASASQPPDRAYLRLAKALDQDLAQSRDQCSKGRSIDPNARRRIRFRGDSVEALLTLVQDGVLSATSPRAIEWAHAIADLDAATWGASQNKASPGQWTRCTQALLELHRDWAGQGQVHPSRYPELTSCWDLDSPALVAHMLRRQDRNHVAGIEDLRRGYFLAVEHRYSELAAEMAIRVGLEDLTRHEEQQAQMWLDHAMAWHGVSLDQACPALRNLYARVQLVRDPSLAHHAQILKQWRGDAEMDSYRRILSLRDADALAGQGQFKQAVARLTELKEELSELDPRQGSLKMRATAYQLLAESSPEELGDLNLTGAGHGLEAHALRVWKHLLTDSPKSALQRALDAMQEQGAAVLTRLGCASVQRERWSAMLDLEALAAAKLEHEGPGVLSAQCPMPRKPLAGLDLNLAQRLLSQSKARFIVDSQTRHAHYGQCVGATALAR